jgi:hypothetical protein
VKTEESDLLAKKLFYITVGGTIAFALAVIFYVY